MSRADLLNKYLKIIVTTQCVTFLLGEGGGGWIEAPSLNISEQFNTSEESLIHDNDDTCKVQRHSCFCYVQKHMDEIETIYVEQFCIVYASIMFYQYVSLYVLHMV